MKTYNHTYKDGIITCYTLPMPDGISKVKDWNKSKIEVNCDEDVKKFIDNSLIKTNDKFPYHIDSLMDKIEIDTPFCVCERPCNCATYYTATLKNIEQVEVIDWESKYNELKKAADDMANQIDSLIEFDVIASSESLINYKKLTEC